MKFVRILLTVIFIVIYWPANTLFNMCQKFYLKLKKDKEHDIPYLLFAPLYWIVFIITSIISAPYEWLIAKDLH